MSTTKKIQDKLKIMLKEKQITQKRIAEIMMLDRTEINRLLNSDRKVSIDKLDEIAAIVGYKITLRKY